MIEPFKDLGEVWQDAFSWFVYPIRMPLLIVAWVLLIRLLTPWLVHPLGGIISWTSPKLARLVGTVLLAPEYAYTMRLMNQGAGIPLALRLYGHWVENVTDWTTASGRALGRRLRKLSYVSTETAIVLVLLYVAVYNVHAVGHAGQPEPPKAPVTIWWESFQVWLDDPQRPLWTDSPAASRPPQPTPQPSPTGK
ncbi:hypothetical protein ACFZBP_38050 [Streptomyces sp. NPDC008086]|uniref:hypothetical protein n=1 Tax=Streptomyces sp. NPDC008086 TaxID=3364807 RepID=UPI0036E6F3DE